MKKLNKILFTVIAGLFIAGVASASLGEYWSTVSHIIPRTNDTVDLGSTAKRVRTLFVNNLTCTDCVDDTNIDWGTGANQVSSADMPDHNSHTVRDTFVDIINRGKSEEITVTLTGGLGVSWTAGELYDGNTNTFFSTDAGSGNVTNNAVNYLKWVSGTALTLSTTGTSGDEILVATGSVYDGNINCYRETSLMNETVSNTRRGLRALFPTRITSGMSVHEDTDVTNDLDVTMDAGVFYKDAIEEKTPIEIKSRNTAMIRNFHTAGVWDSDTNAQIETTNYDNGTDLTAIPANKYVKGLFIFMCDNIGFVYPTEYFNTVAQAQDAALPTLPPGLDPVPKLTAIVYQQGDTDFSGAIWQDVRAGISEESFSGVTDHGALAGLSDDDHTQYILADGTRAFSGQVLATYGTVSAPGYSFDSDTDTGIYREASDLISFATGGTRALTVAGSYIQSDRSFFLSGSSTPLYGTSVSGGDLYLESTNNATKGDVVIQRNGGKVGIGTNSPGSVLDIESSGEATVILKSTDITQYTGINMYESSGALAASFQYGNPSAASFTNEFIFASRQSDIAMKFYQGGVAGANTRLTFDTSGNVIFPTGNIGINTASPGTLLQLEKDGDAYLTLKNATDENTDGGAETRIIFEDHENAALAQIQGSHDGTGVDTKGDLIFSTHSGSALTEAMRIDSSGNVGIGTNNPTNPLHIVYGGADNEVFVVDASGSSLDSSPAFGIRLPATGARKGFQMHNGADSFAWASFEFNVGGASKPGFALGPGGSSARDVSIYRDAAGVLKTNSSFITGGYITTAGDIDIIKTAVASQPQLVLENDDTRWLIRNDGADSDKLIFRGNASGSYATDLTLDGSTGNVGIGTTTPEDVLEVEFDQDGTTSILIENNTNDIDSCSSIKVRTADSTVAFGAHPSNYTAGGVLSHFADRGNIFVYDNTSGFDIVVAAGAGDLRTFTGGYTTAHERMRIDSTGNVGIGTTSPDTNLHINDASTTTDLYIESGGAGLGGRIILEDTDGAGCTAITTLNGVLTAAIIACP